MTIRGQRLQVVGIDDAYTGHHDIERAVRGLRNNIPLLGLSHIAEESDHLWNKGIPLVLSGHTHAGQVTLAGLHELAMGKWAGHKYVQRSVADANSERGDSAGRGLCERGDRRVGDAAAAGRARPTRSCRV